MRLVRRLLHALLLVLMLVVGATAAAVIVTQTLWFKNWLRGYVVREAGQYLNGTLSISRLGGNLFYGLRLEDVDVTVDGMQVVSVKDATFDYSAFELISRGLSLDAIHLNQPVVYLRREGETWSIGRLIKKQEQEADRSGPARPVSIGTIGITDGAVVVDDPVGMSGLAVPKRFDHLDATLAFQYEPVRYSIDITQVSFRGSDPGIALNALSGRVSVRDDTVYVDQLAMKTGESSLLVKGAIQQYLTKPVFNMEVSSDKVSLPEVARLVPSLEGIRLQPAFELRLDGPLDRLGAVLDVRSSAGQLTGKIVADALDPGQSFVGTLSVRKLDLAPVLNDRSKKSDITADVRLDLRAADLTDLDSLRGTVGIDAPRIATPQVVAERVKGTARIDGRRLRIDAAASAYGAGATVAGQVVLPASQQGPLGLDLRGRLQHLDLRRLPKNVGAPQAATNVNGTFTAAGSVTPSTGSRNLRAALEFAPSEVAGARIAEGSRVALTLAGSDVAYEADTTIAGLDLQRVGRDFGVPALESDRYASEINGRIAGSGRGTRIGELTATAHGTLRDTSVIGGRIPQLSFDADVQGESAHLRATGAIDGLDPAVLSDKPALKGNIAGMLDVDATLSNLSANIRPEDVRATAHVEIEPSMVGGLTISRGTVAGDYKDGSAELRMVEITGPDATLRANGQLALTDTGQSNLEVHASSSNLETIGKIVEQPIAGIASVDAKVTGNRHELAARGMVTGGGLRYGTNGALGVDSTFDATVPDLRIADARLSATTSATFVTLFGQNINTISAKTDYAASRLDFSASAKQPQRTLDVAGGLITHPDHDELHVERLALTTQGVTWQTASGPEATIQYGGDTVAINDLKLVNGDQEVAADGRFGGADDALSVRFRNVDVALVDALLLREPQLGGRLNGTAVVTADVTSSNRGPQVKADFTIANGNFKAFRYDSFGGTVDYDKSKIALNTKLQQTATTWLEAKGELPTALLDERGWTSPDPIDLHIDSTQIDAGLVQGFTTALSNVLGTVEAHVHLTGTAADPRADGEVKVQDGSFMVESNGVQYSDLDGRIELAPDRVRIAEMRLLDNHQSPLTVSGDLAIRERTVGEMSVAVKAQDFKVIDNEMGNVRVNTDLQLTGQLNAPRVEGQLAVTTGEINLDAILNAVGTSAYSTEPIQFSTTEPPVQPESASPAPAASSGFPGMSGLAKATQIDVALTVPNDLIVKASDLRAPGQAISLGQLNLTLGGDLYIHQVPYDQIRLYGAVRTVRGTYDFQGRRFTILRDGTLRFDGLDDFDPDLDVRTERVIQAVTARVDVRGTVKQPQIVLSSTPPLEPADVLSLIVFNQPINQLGAGDQQTLAQRAQALATGAAANQLASSLGQALNLDIFEISTASESGRVGAEVTLGQQVGQNLFLKVQQGIGDQTNTNFILEYELTNWLRLQTNMLQGNTNQPQVFERQKGSGADLLFFFSY